LQKAAKNLGKQVPINALATLHLNWIETVADARKLDSWEALKFPILLVDEMKRLIRKG
jgi:hypothetical protein